MSSIDVIRGQAASIFKEYPYQSRVIVPDKEFEAYFVIEPANTTCFVRVQVDGEAFPYLAPNFKIMTAKSPTGNGPKDITLNGHPWLSQFYQSRESHDLVDADVQKHPDLLNWDPEAVLRGVGRFWLGAMVKALEYDIIAWSNRPNAASPIPQHPPQPHFQQMQQPPQQQMPYQPQQQGFQQQQHSPQPHFGSPQAQFGAMHMPQASHQPQYGAMAQPQYQHQPQQQGPNQSQPAFEEHPQVMTADMKAALDQIHQDYPMLANKTIFELQEIMEDERAFSFFFETAESKQALSSASKTLTEMRDENRRIAEKSLAMNEKELAEAKSQLAEARKKLTELTEKATEMLKENPVAHAWTKEGKFESTRKARAALLSKADESRKAVIVACQAAMENSGAMSPVSNANFVTTLQQYGEMQATLRAVQNRH